MSVASIFNTTTQTLQTQVSPPCGLFSTATSNWVTIGGGQYTAYASNVSPYLTSNSVVIASVQSASGADASNAPLLENTPSASNGGQIQFVTLAQPQNGTQFIISWAVMKY